MVGANSCSACGAAIVKSQRFCRSCGSAVAADEAFGPTTKVGSKAGPGASAPRSTGGRFRGWWIVLAVALAIGLAAATAVVIVVVPSGSDSTKSSETTIVTTADPVQDPGPDLPDDTLPTVPVTPTAVAAQVARTCGSSGNGDCFLTVRVAPTTNSAGVRRLDEGASLLVVCQVPGEAVRSSLLSSASTAWARTPDNYYVSSVYVDAPGFDPLRISVPCP